jgi:hypothetical protein
VLLLAPLLLLACGGGDETFDPSKYAGTYEGNWLNQAAALTGPGSLTIAIDEAKKTASITIDLGGNYLGMGDPAPVAMNGTYDDKRAQAKGSDQLFGDYDIVIDAKGNITGTMERLAGGTIPKLTFEGKLTNSRLDIDYVVQMPNGGEVKSKVTMARK